MPCLLIRSVFLPRPGAVIQIYNQVVYSYEDREEILQLLKEHVTENIVKVSHFLCCRLLVLTGIIQRLDNHSTGRLSESRRGLCSRQFCAHSSMEIWRPSCLNLLMMSRVYVPPFTVLFVGLTDGMFSLLDDVPFSR